MLKGTGGKAVVVTDRVKALGVKGGRGDGWFRGDGKPRG